MFFDNLFDDFNPFGTYTYRQPRPQTASMFKNDNKSIILRKLVNDEYNYMCFDCHKEISDLEYFDLKNGIFLCPNCAQQHAKFSKEITQPMTGSINSLEEKDLLLLYYGGNKNLLDFIRRHFPLLENMQPKEMYATKAMDYYRKLIRSKAYDEPEPGMPGKKKGYHSILQKSPATERKPKQNNIRDRRTIGPFDRDEDRDNIFSSTFFGDDLFNRNKQNQRKRTFNDEEDNYLRTEPADINKHENDEKDDAGMKVEKRNNSHENKEKECKTERKINEPKYKKIERKTKHENKENKEEEIKVNVPNILTINQIGEMTMYPEAMEIDGMECA